MAPEGKALRRSSFNGRCSGAANRTRPDVLVDVEATIEGDNSGATTMKLLVLLGVIIAGMSGCGAAKLAAHTTHLSTCSHAAADHRAV
jgi:hypothetical protein